MTQWHRIHDFISGYGLREVIPDNEITINEFPAEEGCGIPARYVRYKQEERVIFLYDATRLLEIDIFSVPEEELDDIYNKLQPLLEEERQKRKEWIEAHPFNPKKITIPKINRAYPKLIASEIVNVQPMKGVFKKW